jgi:hypothetical protein
MLMSSEALADALSAGSRLDSDLGLEAGKVRAVQRIPHPAADRLTDCPTVLLVFSTGAPAVASWEICPHPRHAP